MQAVHRVVAVPHTASLGHIARSVGIQGIPHLDAGQRSEGTLR